MVKLEEEEKSKSNIISCRSWIFGKGSWMCDDLRPNTLLVRKKLHLYLCNSNHYSCPTIYIYIYIVGLIKYASLFYIFSSFQKFSWDIISCVEIQEETMQEKLEKKTKESDEKY
jgi:hypothetical protein